VPGILKTDFVNVDAERLVTFGIGAVLLAVMTFLIEGTKIGQQMLLFAQDSEGAALQGIDIPRTGRDGDHNRLPRRRRLPAPSMATMFQMKPLHGRQHSSEGHSGRCPKRHRQHRGILAGGLIIGFMNAVFPVFIEASVGPGLLPILIVIGILSSAAKGLFGYELF